VTVKKETKPTAVKDAKSDFSFFSAPKAKPKLPSFKKAPPAPTPTANAKRESGTNVANTAQPSSIDPFQEALKSMKSRKDSPAVSTPPAVPTSSTPPLVLQQTQPGVAKNGKQKKSVSWAPEDKLESVRFIEKAVYDDDPVDVSYLSFLFVACVRYLTVHFVLLPPHKKTSCFCVF
jgi:protein phosphatase 1 regulatory subunit 10